MSFSTTAQNVLFNMIIICRKSRTYFPRNTIILMPSNTEITHRQFEKIIPKCHTTQKQPMNTLKNIPTTKSHTPMHAPLPPRASLYGRLQYRRCRLPPLAAPLRSGRNISRYPLGCYPGARRALESPCGRLYTCLTSLPAATAPS